MCASLLAMAPPTATTRFVAFASAPPYAIQIRLLGGLRVLIDGEDVTSKLKYRKGIGVLALLAVECDVAHTREQLCELFWPDLPLSAARSNLRQVLSNLNKLFRQAAPNGDAGLVITTGGVGLFSRPQLHIDVASLGTACAVLHNNEHHDPAHLRAILPFLEVESLRSEFLPGFELPDCEAFTAWLDVQRRYCADRVLTLYDDMAQRAMALGNLELAIDYSRQVELVDPLLEPNQARLMRLLASSGRERHALRQFDGFARRLREELDVEPHADTRTLRDQIAARTSIPVRAARKSNEISHGSAQCAVSVIYAAFAIADSQGDGRGASLRQAHKTISHLLGQYGAHIMSSPRLGVYAWFTSCDDAHTGCGASAMQAARAIIDSASNAFQVRIGVYTGTMALQDDDELPVGLDEGAELASRLSLIADAGDIVASATTTHGASAATEPLGEWKFRGIAQSLEVLRIRPKALRLHPLVRPATTPLIAS